MTNKIRILIVLTSQSTMGDSDRPTGVWFEELSAPYYTFADAGVEVDLASIAGGPIPIDPGSSAAAGQNPPSVERFLGDKVAMRKLGASLKVGELLPDGYSAVFLPGGHGTMWDMPENKALAVFLSDAWAKGKVVSAVCHGPAGLLGAKDADGRPIVSGRRVSSFTDAEETAVGLQNVVPFLLESRLRKSGAKFEKGPNFGPYAVRDGNLVTGQNPASSEKVARLVLDIVRSV